MARCFVEPPIKTKLRSQTFIEGEEDIVEVSLGVRQIILKIGEMVIRITITVITLNVAMMTACVVCRALAPTIDPELTTTLHIMIVAESTTNLVVMKMCP